MNVIKQIATWWNDIPQPLRDFGEGVIAVAVAGAAIGVLSVDLTNPTLTARAVEFAAITGATAAVLAYLRQRLADVPKPTPPVP